MTASLRVLITAALLTASAGVGGAEYPDGRAVATLRYDAQDQGMVLPYGHCRHHCDEYGARDVWVFAYKGRYYMHYDAAGPTGWLTALATSRDLVHWKRRGTVLKLGKPGADDSASASYGTTYFDGQTWHMFYMGTPHATAAPNRIPAFPYMTMKARARGPKGPWVKEPEVTPFRPQPGTYYSTTASPGEIVRQGGEYMQFFSASTNHPVLRTISIARTTNLEGAWTVDPQPILPQTEQIENASLYFEPTNGTWFLFTNHVGMDKPGGYGEYTDSIWVYWTRDLNHWNAADKAIVLDGKNCIWSHRCIGLPSVVPYGKRLAIFYDAPGGDRTTHMRRSIGLAWLNLPLTAPKNRD